MRDSLNRQSRNGIWLWFAASISIFPLFPVLGALGLFIANIRIWVLNRRQIIADRVNRGLGVLTILLVISSIFAQQPQEAGLGLANFLPFFWLFVGMRELIDRPIQLKQLSWLLILPSVAIAILGFGQLYGGWDTPALLESILGWELVPGGVPASRMSSVFIYTNFLAIYLAIAIALALGLWLDSWQAWQQKSKDKQALVLLSLTAILSIDLGGLILTSSRNAWGLVIVSFLAYALYLGWYWLVYGVMGAAAAILWAAFAPNIGGRQLRIIVPAFFWERLSDTAYDRPIETLRITQWQFCWELIEQRPILGWGLRNFSPLYEAQTNYWFGHPHSLFLMLGAEAGIIAVFLLIAIVGWIMYRASLLLVCWSHKKFKLIYFSYLVAFANCVLFNLLDVTIFDLRVNTISWIILAAISGIAGAKLNINNSPQAIDG